MTLRSEARTEHLWCTLGGPISTVLVGTVGLIALARRRRRPGRQESLDALDWTLTITALFWSREVFVMLSHALGISASHRGRSDETTIAGLLGLPLPSIPVLLGMLGLAVCITVTLRHPRGCRLPFVLGGAAGCAVGFVAWYGWLGPHLLP
jgi:hypothetical protein